MKNFSFKNVMYAIGTSLFLIMLIFTLSTSLINPMYGMSEGAVMEMESSSDSSNTGGYSCTVTLDCGDGTISCSGDTLCTRGNGWIACDGNYTYC